MPLNEVDRLVVANLPYARSLARRYRRPGLDVDDLEQEAALALVEAAKKFEPEKNPGVPFVAFARPFLVRRLGVIACPEALASLPHDLPAPSDPAAECAATELWSALEVLPDREQAILIRRFGLTGQPPAELEDLCKEFKLSYRRLTELLQAARVILEAELYAARLASAPGQAGVESHQVSVRGHGSTSLPEAGSRRRHHPPISGARRVRRRCPRAACAAGHVRPVGGNHGLGTRRQR